MSRLHLLIYIILYNISYIPSHFDQNISDLRPCPSDGNLSSPTSYTFRPRRCHAFVSIWHAQTIMHQINIYCFVLLGGLMQVFVGIAGTLIGHMIIWQIKAYYKTHGDKLWGHPLDFHWQCRLGATNAILWMFQWSSCCESCLQTWRGPHCKLWHQDGLWKTNYGYNFGSWVCVKPSGLNPCRSLY